MVCYGKVLVLVWPYGIVWFIIVSRNELPVLVANYTDLIEDQSAEVTLGFLLSSRATN